MKTLWVIVLAILLTSTLGCAKKDAVPAPAPPTAWALPKDIPPSRILISAQGSHFAYLRTEADGTSTVVRDGTEVAKGLHLAERTNFGEGGLPNLLPPLYLSPNETTLVWVVAAGKGQRVVVDGTPDPVYNEVGNVVFSTDGRHRAYAARVGKAWHVVKDGKDEPGAFTAFGGLQGFGADPTLVNPVLSADGAHLLYVATIDGGMVLVVDGKRYGPYRIIDGLSATRDLSSYAVRVRSEHTARILDTGTLLPAADDVSVPRVSADGTHLAYMRRVKESYHLILDGAAKPTWDRKMRPVTFSPDGTRVAFVGTGYEGQDALIVDGVVKGFAEMKNDGIYGIYFSPDSKRVAYRTRNRLVVVGEAKLGGRISEHAGGIFFSPDSQHLAYLAETDKGAVLMRDTTALAPVASWLYGATFSPDSAHLVAATAVPGKARHMQVLVDGTPTGATYDDLLTFPYDHGPNFFFTAADRFFYYAIKDGELRREEGRVK
jgi:hypothetical protein